MASARGMTASEYAALFRLRDLVRHVRAWAFDRTLVVRPIMEALADVLGGDEGGGEEVIEAEGTVTGSQDPALPRPRIRRRAPRLPPGYVPRGREVDMEGPLFAIQQLTVRPENVEAYQGWVAKHGRDDALDAASAKPMVQLGGRTITQ